MKITLPSFLRRFVTLPRWFNSLSDILRIPGVKEWLRAWLIQHVLVFPSAVRSEIAAKLGISVEDVNKIQAMYQKRADEELEKLVD